MADIYAIYIIQGLQQQVADRNTRIVELSREVSNLRKDVEHGKCALGELMAILGEKNSEIARLSTEIAKLRSDQVEWFCEKCNRVCAFQIPGHFLQPCPICQAPLIPSSYNLRELSRLRAKVEALRACREAWRQLARVPQQEHELVRINVGLAQAADAKARECGAIE